MTLLPWKWKVPVRSQSALCASLVVALMLLYWPLAGALIAIAAGKIGIIPKILIAAMLIGLAVYLWEQARQMVTRYNQSNSVK